MWPMVPLGQLNNLHDVLTDISAPAALFLQFSQDLHLWLLLKVRLRLSLSTLISCVDFWRSGGAIFYISPHVAWRSLPCYFLRHFFLWRTATKHFSPRWQRFVLRAFCVLVTTDACFSFLFLPDFNKFHLLFSFFFAPRLHSFMFPPASLRTSLSPFLFLLALACAMCSIMRQSMLPAWVRRRKMYPCFD